MFYGASTFEQNLNIWLKWVTKVSHSNWCGGGGTVCHRGFTFTPTNSPSTNPPIVPSKLPSASTSVEMKLTSRNRLITHVRIYCRNPANYNSQYG